MDLNLICTQIQELLIKNERVVLPGIGEFVVESHPASFLEDGKTIVPPSKKLHFNPVADSQQQEGVLVELSGIIRESLVEKGVFEVPGFGVFADNGAGEVTFTVDESFDFAPDNFSLEAISLEVNEEPEKLHEPQTMAQKDARKRSAMWILLALVFLAVLVLFVLLFKESLAPVLENILYTDEELEIMKKWAAQ